MAEPRSTPGRCMAAASMRPAAPFPKRPRPGSIFRQASIRAPIRCRPSPPEALTRLPDVSAFEAAEAAAARAYGAPPGFVAVAGAGTQAFIDLLPRVFPARRVATLGFCYAEHAARWRAAGASVTLASSLDELASMDVAIVVNPNNPGWPRHAACGAAAPRPAPARARRAARRRRGLRGFRARALPRAAAAERARGRRERHRSAQLRQGLWTSGTAARLCALRAVARCGACARRKDLGASPAPRSPLARSRSMTQPGCARRKSKRSDRRAAPRRVARGGGFLPARRNQSFPSRRTRACGEELRASLRRRGY